VSTGQSTEVSRGRHRSANGLTDVVRVELGPIGLAIADLVQDRESLRSVAAVDVRPELVGKPFADFLAKGSSALRFRIGRHLPEPPKTSRPWSCIQPARRSSRLLHTHLIAAARAGMNRPARSSHIRSARHRRSRPTSTERHASLAWPAWNRRESRLCHGLPASRSSGTTRSVAADEVHHVQDAGLRRLPLQRKTGAGMTVAHCRDAVTAGSPHVGFLEYLHAIAAGLGWSLDEAAETISPVIAESPVDAGIGRIGAGQVLGVRQVAVGKCAGDELVRLSSRCMLARSGPRRHPI
jgi:hypothetical protein